MRGVKYYFFNVYLLMLFAIAFIFLISSFFLNEPTRNLGKVIICLLLGPAVTTVLIALNDRFGNETPDKKSK